MTETPRRLKPKPKIVRELYLKSGNECAFPECDRKIMNNKGVLLGEICHIEAAKPSAPRFNPEQTNDERRAFSNLLLMCHDHHIITDDESEFSVERMQQLKADHETIYTDIILQLLDSITDQTTTTSSKSPKSLRRINDVLEWDLSDEQLDETAIDIESILEILKRTPRRARELLVILIDRGSRHSFLDHDLVANHFDIIEACEISDETVIRLVRVLEQHGLARGQDTDKGSIIEVCGLDWPFWEDLKKFAKTENIPLKTFIIDLQFDKLD